MRKYRKDLDKKLHENHQWIMENWEKYTYQFIADKFGCPYHTYRQYLYKSGCKRTKEGEIVHWTNDDVNFLKSNYQEIGNIEIGKILKRSPNSVAQKLIKMKISRTTEQIAMLNSISAKKNKFGIDHGRSKKRTIGETWKYKGAWRIKTEKGIYVWHELLYRQKYGRKPKSKVLEFRDGNVDNVTIENIIAIPIHRFSKKSKVHIAAMKLSYIDRIAMGYTPHQTQNGTVFY